MGDEVSLPVDPCRRTHLLVSSSCGPPWCGYRCTLLLLGHIPDLFWVPCRGAVVVISSDLLVSLLQLSITCIRQGGQNVATPVVNIAGAGKVQTPRIPLSNLRACKYLFFSFLFSPHQSTQCSSSGETGLSLRQRHVGLLVAMKRSRNVAFFFGGEISDCAAFFPWLDWARQGRDTRPTASDRICVGSF